MKGDTHFAYGVDYGSEPGGLVLEIDIVFGIFSFSFFEGNLDLSGCSERCSSRQERCSAYAVREVAELVERRRAPVRIW